MQDDTPQPRQFRSQMQCWSTSNRLSIQDQIFLANSVLGFKALVHCFDISIRIRFARLDFTNNVNSTSQQRLQFKFLVDSIEQ